MSYESKASKSSFTISQVLAMLLEHPGELITREELKKKLWPLDTFVDFDVGLNSAVKKLRDAL
ncbi:MAG TPA: helix-turn-helix domain-containing protein, partial [Candidatus Sulfotelmatobacter sp.]|nr:helix-turn-helix domain-containing protein [Candidatus Sulfotelmatobacter sp.]